MSICTKHNREGRPVFGSLVVCDWCDAGYPSLPQTADEAYRLVAVQNKMERNPYTEALCRMAYDQDFDFDKPTIVAQPKQYDPEAVTLTFKGQPIKGSVAGTFIGVDHAAKDRAIIRVATESVGNITIQEVKEAIPIRKDNVPSHVKVYESREEIEKDFDTDLKDLRRSMGMMDGFDKEPFGHPPEFKNTYLGVLVPPKKKPFKDRAYFNEVNQLVSPPYGGASELNKLLHDMQAKNEQWWFDEIVRQMTELGYSLHMNETMTALCKVAARQMVQVQKLVAKMIEYMGAYW